MGCRRTSPGVMPASVAPGAAERRVDAAGAAAGADPEGAVDRVEALVPA